MEAPTTGGGGAKDRAGVVGRSGVKDRLCSSVGQPQPGKRRGWGLQIGPPSSLAEDHMASRHDGNLIKPVEMEILRGIKIFQPSAGATDRFDDTCAIDRLCRTHPSRMRKKARILVYR